MVAVSGRSQISARTRYASPITTPSLTASPSGSKTPEHSLPVDFLVNSRTVGGSRLIQGGTVSTSTARLLSAEMPTLSVASKVMVSHKKPKKQPKTKDTLY